MSKSKNYSCKKMESGDIVVYKTTYFRTEIKFRRENGSLYTTFDEIFKLAISCCKTTEPDLVQQINTVSNKSYNCQELFITRKDFDDEKDVKFYHIELLFSLGSEMSLYKIYDLKIWAHWILKESRVKQRNDKIKELEDKVIELRSHISDKKIGQNFREIQISNELSINQYNNKVHILEGKINHLTQNNQKMAQDLRELKVFVIHHIPSMTSFHELNTLNRNKLKELEQEINLLSEKDENTSPTLRHQLPRKRPSIEISIDSDEKYELFLKRLKPQ